MAPNYYLVLHGIGYFKFSDQELPVYENYQNVFLSYYQAEYKNQAHFGWFDDELLTCFGL